MNQIDIEEINKLIQQIGTGYVKMADTLYNKTYNNLFNFLRRFSSDKELIKDACHSTFCIVIQKSKFLPYVKNGYNWMCTISKNQLYYHAKKKNHVLFSDKLNDFGYSYDVIKMDLRLAVQKLDDESQYFIYLRYKLKLKLEEIAEIQNMSVSTVKRRLQNIIDELKEKMQ